MTHITGTIAAPALRSAHHDPETVNGGDWGTGATPVISVGSFTNTGDTDLTFSGVTITDPINCEITDTALVVAGTVTTETEVVLHPGEDASVQVSVHLGTPTPGTTEEFSFDATGIWS